jgi:hypothetical protein
MAKKEETFIKPGDAVFYVSWKSISHWIVSKVTFKDTGKWITWDRISIDKEHVTKAYGNVYKTLSEFVSKSKLPKKFLDMIIVY